MITTNLIETGALEQVITSFYEETFLKISYPELTPVEKLQKSHPLVKNVFLKLDIPKVPLAGRFNHFVRI